MALGGGANLTACSPTRTMAGSSGAATSSTYRDTVEYSAILAGRVGVYYPYRLYAYRYAPGIGLPPYREWPARPGRTVRGTVRSNPKRSYLDSFRLFWKSRGKSTRACGKNTRWLRLDLIEVSPGHFDSGPRDSSGLLGSCIVSHSGANHAAACNCFCVWLLRFGLCGMAVVCSKPHYLLPPLVKGRGTAEGGGRVATLQRVISLRQET